MVHYLTSCSKGSQFGKRLLAWSTHPNQKGMSAVHTDNAMDSGQVLQCIVKQNQIHSGLEFIIFLKNLLQQTKLHVSSKW